MIGSTGSFVILIFGLALGFALGLALGLSISYWISSLISSFTDYALLLNSSICSLDSSSDIFDYLILVWQNNFKIKLNIYSCVWNIKEKLTWESCRLITLPWTFLKLKCTVFNDCLETSSLSWGATTLSKIR